MRSGVLTAIFLCHAAALFAALPPEAFELHEQPEINSFAYEVAWGTYRVSVVPLSQVEHRFRICDRAGHVLREIRAPFIDYIRYPNLSGRNRGEDLVVLAHPMQNTIADIRLYAFTRHPHLRNILAMPEGYDSVRDLDHDGRPEFVLDAIFPFEWALGGHSSPTVMLVLRWEHGHYRLETRRFPAVARSRAREYRADFLRQKAAIDALQVVPGEKVYEMRVSAAGYWANRAVIGDERAALRWLLPKLWPTERRIFLEEIPHLRDKLKKIPRSIGVDHRKLITVAF